MTIYDRVIEKQFTEIKGSESEVLTHAANHVLDMSLQNQIPISYVIAIQICRTVEGIAKGEFTPAQAYKATCHWLRVHAFFTLEGIEEEIAK